MGKLMVLLSMLYLFIMAACTSPASTVPPEIQNTATAFPTPTKTPSPTAEATLTAVTTEVPPTAEAPVMPVWEQSYLDVLDAHQLSYTVEPFVDGMAWVVGTDEAGNEVVYLTMDEATGEVTPREAWLRSVPGYPSFNGLMRWNFSIVDDMAEKADHDNPPDGNVKLERGSYTIFSMSQAEVAKLANDGGVWVWEEGKDYVAYQGLAVYKYLMGLSEADFVMDESACAIRGQEPSLGQMELANQFINVTYLCEATHEAIDENGQPIEVQAYVFRGYGESRIIVPIYVDVFGMTAMPVYIQDGLVFTAGGRCELSAKVDSKYNNPEGVGSNPRALLHYIYAIHTDTDSIFQSPVIIGVGLFR